MDFSFLAYQRGKENGNLDKKRHIMLLKERISKNLMERKKKIIKGIKVRVKSQ